MNIYITLDYELFMGSNTGTVENCLLIPMSHLTSMLDKYNIKAVIFVDAAYLLRLSKLKDTYAQLAKDYDLVCNNLQKLTSEGHDVEMHFHPQWLYSEYNLERNKWIMDLEHYKLADIDEVFAANSFKTAKDLLDSIINRKTIAFRAGGYSLKCGTPYSRLLIDNGIKFDSSVLPYCKNTGRFQDYDYSDIPDKSSWLFSTDVCKEDPEGQIREMPISSSNKLFSLSYLYYKSKSKKDDTLLKKWGDGNSIDGELSVYERALSYFKKIIQGMTVKGSLDHSTSCFLEYTYNYARKKKRDEFVIIAHPKEMSSISIDFFECFIQRVIKRDSFVTFISKQSINNKQC